MKRTRPTAIPLWRGVIGAVLVGGAAFGGASCGRQATKPGKPLCLVEPDTLDFGRVEIDSMKIRTFVVRNAGSAGEPVSVSLGCPPFELLEGGGDTTLAPGESLAVRVEFAPRERDSVRCVVDLGSISCGGVALIANASRTWRIRPDGTGDAPTVQAGIDSSEDGDVVLVGPGTYYENINLEGKAIHLLSKSGPVVTVLDGSREDSTVVNCESGETNDTIIEGFTITGGRGWTPLGDTTTKAGGGISCYHSTPIIRNNVIRDNQALNGPRGGNSRGGAINIGSRGASQPMIVEGNIIEGNYCSRNSGGINIAGPCIIQDNVIRGNSTGTGDGGGLYLLGTVGHVVIRRNLIVENHAADHGGGLYLGNVFGGDPNLIEVSGNIIVANAALGSDGPDYCSGAGIWVFGGAYIHHNTLALNVAETEGSGLTGGGLCLRRAVRGTRVEYNLFYRNDEGGLVTDDRTTAELLRNLFYGDTRADIESLDGAEISENGDLFMDPLFCDTTATSQGGLAAGSPALIQPYGVIGAVSEPGCSLPEAKPSVWAQGLPRE